MNQTSITPDEQESPAVVPTGDLQSSQMEGRVSTSTLEQTEDDRISLWMVAIFVLFVIALALSAILVLKLLGFSLFA